MTSKTRKVQVALLILSALISSACGGNEAILRSGKEPASQSNAEPAKSSFEAELQAVRTADFSFVYVLRRKDRGVIDAEDKSVIRLQTAQANRRVSADDGKAFIIGSNFELPPKNMAAIYERFAVENYSPAPSPTVSNANANN